MPPCRKCRRTPLAAWRELGQSTLGVVQHLLDSVLAHSARSNAIQGQADLLPSGNAPLSAPRMAMSSHRSASAACPCNACIQPPITATAGYRSSSASSPKRSSQASTVLIRPLSYAGCERGDETCDARLVARGVGVLETRLRVAILLVPIGCSAVELRHELGLGLGQLSREQVVKQVVIAVPLAVPVERHEEEV